MSAGSPGPDALDRLADRRVALPTEATHTAATAAAAPPSAATADRPSVTARTGLGSQTPVPGEVAGDLDVLAHDPEEGQVDLNW